MKKEIKYEGLGIDLRVYYKCGHLWGGRVLLSCDVKDLGEIELNTLIEELEDIQSLLISLRNKE